MSNPSQPTGTHLHLPHIPHPHLPKLPEEVPNHPIHHRIMDFCRPFLFGGLSGCFATSIIQPIDTVKVQIQVIGESNANKAVGGATLSTSPFNIASNVIKSEGIKGLYKGLDAALLRQITYGTTRLGLFRLLTDEYVDRYDRHPSLAWKAIFSSFAGFVGCLVGNPADLALVRCQRDSLLPAD